MSNKHPSDHAWDVAKAAVDRMDTSSWNYDEKGEEAVAILEAAGFDVMREIVEVEQIEAALVARREQVSILQQREDECIVALGSLGTLPSELPQAIKQIHIWNHDIGVERDELQAQLDAAKYHSDKVQAPLIEQLEATNQVLREALGGLARFLNGETDNLDQHIQAAIDLLEVPEEQEASIDAAN